MKTTRDFRPLTDDGTGIADASVLLSFGENGWNEDLVASEDAAGMGMLSLARRGCTVFSRPRAPDGAAAPGWRVALRAGALPGRGRGASPARRHRALAARHHRHVRDHRSRERRRRAQGDRVAVSALDALPPDFDRHRDALLIAETGACNPSGIVITLSQACRQVIREGGAQRTDPAVRLIGLQLAFLLGRGRGHRHGGVRPPDRRLPRPRGRGPERRPGLSPAHPAPRRQEDVRPAGGRPGEAAREPTPPRRPAGTSTHVRFGERHARRHPGAGRPRAPGAPPRTRFGTGHGRRRPGPARRGHRPRAGARSRPAPRCRAASHRHDHGLRRERRRRRLGLEGRLRGGRGRRRAVPEALRARHAPPPGRRRCRRPAPHARDARRRRGARALAHQAHRGAGPPSSSSRPRSRSPILANGWRLARRRIMGADRIEIEGPADTDTATLRRMGCTVEIVSWRARAFAPGARVLDRILERWPLAA